MPRSEEPMRLADFLVTNREPILMEWERFARTCAPSSGAMDVVALRDHADEMLTVIAADLRTRQGPLEQSEKSKGQAPEPDSAEVTAAEEHGAGRAVSGFTVEQMVAEYRALRASVIRLWSEAKGGIVPDDMGDLTRFNEAIDQSLAESVSEFNQNVEQSKEVFLAILGHDLRTPLGAIHTSASVILDADVLDEPYRNLTERIANSAIRTMGMVGDLLDFTRSRLGGGIPVVRAPMDLREVAQDVAQEISAAHSAIPISLDTSGDLTGEWDQGRIRQALSNLIGNAVQHGAEGTPVKVELRGGDDDVSVAVHNTGPSIPAGQLDGIFNPMKPRETPPHTSSGPTGSLGLGLYIAERIVSAHGGQIDVVSSESAGTTFTIHLPREAGGPGEPTSK